MGLSFGRRWVQRACVGGQHVQPVLESKKLRRKGQCFVLHSTLTCKLRMGLSFGHRSIQRTHRWTCLCSENQQTIKKRGQYFGLPSPLDQNGTEQNITLKLLVKDNFQHSTQSVLLIVLKELRVGHVDVPAVQGVSNQLLNRRRSWEGGEEGKLKLLSS